MRKTGEIRAMPVTASLPTDEDSRPGGRPISSIVEDILRHVGEIIRSEVRLAQTEIRQDLSEAKKACAYLAAASVAGMFALGFLLLAGVYGLSTIMPQWAAAISVGAGLAIVGGTLLSMGLRMMKVTSLKPDRTIQSLEDNLRWFKKHGE